MRGVLTGLALGVGLALLLVQHGRIALGTAAPTVVVLVAVALRVVLGVAAATAARGDARQVQTGTDDVGG